MDPLAGQRNAVNAGGDLLEWPDRGRGCPVGIGDRYPLRSCEIVVVAVWRVPGRAGWRWRATIRRSYRDRQLWLLGRFSGYTEDPKFAIQVWEDGPEPEAVAPMEAFA